MMKLPRSSFYYKPKSQSSERMESEADLRDKIEAICLEYSRYGYRRVTQELRYRECYVNHTKVLKIMRESDLLCRVRHRRVKTTGSEHHFPRYSNLRGAVQLRLYARLQSDH